MPRMGYQQSVTQWYCLRLLQTMPQPSQPLSLDCTYPCPVCRQGSLQALVLTDAFACNFCRHILAAELEPQRVKLVDSLHPATWRWVGDRWRPATPKSAEESWLTWFAATFLAIAPASIVGIASYLFPPLPNQPGGSFSHVWAWLTLVAHLGIVAWLLGEHYQVLLYLRAKLRGLRRQWSGL